MEQNYRDCLQYKVGIACWNKCGTDCDIKRIVEENERKHKEWIASLKDHSQICTHDDDNDPLCWSCSNFVFPIGCMLGEE